MNVTNCKLAMMLCFAAKITPNCIGSKGIGKSSAVLQITKSNFHHHPDGSASDKCWGFIDVRLAQSEPADLRGLPDRVEGEGGILMTAYLPPEEMPQHEYLCLACGTHFGINGSHTEDTALPKCPECKSPDVDLHRGVLFLDELNRATDDVLQAAFQLVLDKCIGKYKLPSGWHIATAGNYMKSSGGGGGGYMVNNFSDEAFLDRFCHLHMTIGDDYASDWTQYLTDRYGEASTKVLQFTGFTKENLIGGSQGDMGFTITPSPRSWERVIKVQEVLDEMQADVLKDSGETTFPTDVVRAVFAGLVGHSLADGYMNFSAEITPKDILAHGIKPYEKKLKDWQRPQLAALTWGVTSNAKDKYEDKKVVEHTLDYMEWLCSHKERDLAVGMGKQLMKDQTKSLGTAVLSNKKVREIVLRYKKDGKLGVGWVDSFDKRKSLSDLMSSVAWGSNVG